MAAFDRWASSWGTSWATSWTRADSAVAATQVGGISKQEVDWELLRKRRYRQSYHEALLRDDEEIVALLLANWRRNK